jgi:hypothetical protein
LRSLFATFGVPDELSSDGGPEFTAGLTKDFLESWGVRHRISSAYHPQSNGRAEVAVKSAKRLLRSNVGPNGSLDNDKLLRALLQMRNTPDPDCNLSPAQIIFGRPIRDSLSFVNRLEKYTNPHIRPIWREAWTAKESALRTRFTRTSETLNEHAKPLMPLKIGDKCFIQNQTGNNPNKWHRTGTIVDSTHHDQYVVKVDGSGRLTRRNRRFLRAFKPASLAIANTSLKETWSANDNSTNNPQTLGDVEPSDTLCEPSGETMTNLPPTVFPESAPETVNRPIGASDSEYQADRPTTPRPTSIEETSTTAKKVPAMLRRILPHNSSGLKEDIIAPNSGGRRPRGRRMSNRDI